MEAIDFFFSIRLDSEQVRNEFLNREKMLVNEKKFGKG